MANMHRADSLTSLTSISAKPISGYILLSVEWDSAVSAVTVKVIQAAGLERADGLYVKAYMSVGGKDIKSSKQKTKCKKKTTGPVFEESLSLKHDSAGGTTDHRVQITLWDHGGSHTHKSHCHGWLSFGVRDLMQATSPTAGWFKLQSESEGRTQYEACDPPAAILSDAAARSAAIGGGRGGSGAGSADAQVEVDNQTAFSSRFERNQSRGRATGEVRPGSTVQAGQAEHAAGITTITVVRANGESFGFMLAELNGTRDVPVFVSSVTANGAADKAGLQPGDKLASIEGSPSAAATVQSATSVIAACAVQVSLAVKRSSSPSSSPAAAAEPSQQLPTQQQRRQQTPNQTAAGRVLERVVAGHRYDATHKDELSFDVGDVIHVVDKRETGWWAGHLNGKSGWFPATYVVTGSVVVVVQGDGKTEDPARGAAGAAAAVGASEAAAANGGGEKNDGTTNNDDDLPSPGDSDSAEGEDAKAVAANHAATQAEALKTAAVEIGRLTAALDAARAREKRLEDGKVALEASLKSLREQHVSSARAQQTALTKQMEQVTSSSSESEQQLADALTQLEEEQAKNEKLEEKLAESSFELSDARSSRVELTDRIEKLESANTIAEGAAAAHKKAAAAAAAQLEEEHARHTRSLDSTASAADDMLAQQRAADDKIVSITRTHTFDVAELTAKIESLEMSERRSALALQEEREQRKLAESQHADAERQASGLQRKAESTQDAQSGLYEKIATLTSELELNHRAKLDAEAAAARSAAINKSREDEIETERTRRRGSEERAITLEATVLSSRNELTRATDSAAAARKEMQEFRGKLKELEGIKAENFHLHSILKLKDGKEMLATSIETDKTLREVRRDRDEARAECDRLRSGKGDDVASKFLIRITELEQENEGLTQMVDKMVQQLTTKLTDAE